MLALTGILLGEVSQDGKQRNLEITQTHLRTRWAYFKVKLIIIDDTNNVDPLGKTSKKKLYKE